MSRVTDANDLTGIGESSALGIREILDVFDRPQPSVDHREVEIVVLLMNAGGGDEIVPSQSVNDLRQPEVQRDQLLRINGDVIFGSFSAEHVHARDAGDAQQPRLHLISRGFPKCGLDQRPAASGSRR